MLMLLLASSSIIDEQILKTRNREMRQRRGWQTVNIVKKKKEMDKRRKARRLEDARIKQEINTVIDDYVAENCSAFTHADLEAREIFVQYERGLLIKHYTVGAARVFREGRPLRRGCSCCNRVILDDSVTSLLWSGAWLCALCLKLPRTPKPVKTRKTSTQQKEENISQQQQDNHKTEATKGAQDSHCKAEPFFFKPTDTETLKDKTAEKPSRKPQKGTVTGKSSSSAGKTGDFFTFVRVKPVVEVKNVPRIASPAAVSKDPRGPTKAVEYHRKEKRSAVKKIPLSELGFITGPSFPPSTPNFSPSLPFPGRPVYADPEGRTQNQSDVPTGWRIVRDVKTNRPKYGEMDNSKKAGQNINMQISREAGITAPRVVQSTCFTESFDLLSSQVPKYSSLKIIKSLFIGRRGHHVKGITHTNRCSIGVVRTTDKLTVTVRCSDQVGLVRGLRAAREDLNVIIEIEQEKAEIEDARRLSEQKAAQAASEQARLVAEAAHARGAERQRIENLPLSEVAIAVAKHGTFSEFTAQLRADNIPWDQYHAKKVFREMRGRQS